MYSVNFFICITTALIGLTYAENKHRSSLENLEVKSHRKPKISSEFGYNILNSDRISNHFRQEHRDVNGVVRGSYGFKNPNGLFRLVQYIADSRGYRAHISSNEHGIGKQNPAGVSINRFDHQPLVTEEKIRPPISPLRKQGFIQDRIKLTIDGNIPRYDFYSPIQSQKSNKNQYDSSLFRDESNAYEYDVDRQEFYSSHRQNPVDKLIGTRFSMPDKVALNSPEIDRYNALRRDHVWDSSPFVTKPTEQLLTQHYNRDKFLNAPEILSNENKLEIFSQTRKSNHRNNFANYPDYVAGLYPRPLQRVHNSLPDCNSVSSAVLCKPPLHFRDAYQENRDSENTHLLHDIRHTETSQTLSPDDESYTENSPHSEVALELTDEIHNIYPPHLVPNSYPLRSEIYKKFFSDLTELNQPIRGDKNCQKRTFVDGTTSDDYITPLESHRFSDSADTNDLSLYNLNAHALSLAQNSDLKNSQYSGKQNELYSRLIRIIQSDESLNKLRNLLLQSNQLPSKTTSKTESPKLSLLGVLILPSSVIKELDYDQDEKSQSKYIPEDFDDKSLSENSSESDISDETNYLKSINKSHSTVIYEEDVESKGNVNLHEAQHSKNETDKSILDLPLQQTFNKNNPAQKIHLNSSNIQLPAETVTSPKLYVYDEQTLLDKEKNNNSNFSTDNWRKILEDEISKEIRESSLRGVVPSLDTILDESINSEQNKHSHENQHSFNKHIGPLYDSTGKLIQPENVPMHIHRFNPPSGLTSLPWKYAIPRPAPPRSIVVPPKPPTLS